MFSLYITAIAMGLVGSLHCAGMCGGITVAFNQAVNKEKQLQLSFTYQTFRVISYGFLGVLCASLGYLITDIKLPILPVLSGFFMILLGLYLISFGAPLLGLEKLGHRLWRKIQPIQRSFLPIQTYKQAMIIGLLWGLLPCGLVYSALALAISSANPIEGLIVMFCFGIGTMPMMLSMGQASQKILSWVKKPLIKYSAAIIFVLAGIYYIYSAFAQEHANHQIPNQQSHHEHLHH